MSNAVNNTLEISIDAFLKSISPKSHYYGMGGDVIIPTSDEISLLHMFETMPPTSRDDLAPIARKLNLDQAYILVTFAVRMATLAVRTNSIQVLNAGVFGLVVDDESDNLIDWRDILIALSVIDDSALRLGTNLETIVRGAMNVATADRRDIITGYLLRPPVMRGIKVMKIKAFGCGETFRYQSD